MGGWALTDEKRTVYDSLSDDNRPYIKTARHSMENLELSMNSHSTLLPRPNGGSTPSQLHGFYAWAVSHPSRPAVILEDHITTFGELGARVNAVSHHFQALGLEPGDVVAGFLYNGLEYWELALAAHQSGLHYLPINTHLRPQEVEYILADSGARVLVAHRDLAEGLAGIADFLPSHRFVVGGDVHGWHSYPLLGAGYPEVAPQNPMAGATMGYTSGTTGKPKGVARKIGGASPKSLVDYNLGILARFGVTESEGIHLVCSPLYHAAPYGFALAFLHLGHSLVIHMGFDAEKVLRDIDRYKVTTSHMVPTQFHRLLSLPEDVKASYRHDSLQAVMHAGSPCPTGVKHRMLEWWGPIVWEYLGATEGFVCRVSPEEWLVHPGTHGRPVEGDVLIIGEDGEVLDSGLTGRIYFRPASPFEYLGDADKTAANRRGEHITVGDLGYLDEDGYLFLQDRRSDLIITGGANVYPAEVEQALIMHPDVADVGVIGVADDEWGQKVTAVVQLLPGVTASEDLRRQLLDFAKENLGSYKRPKRIEFLGDFPRTATGKLLRRELREHYDPKNPG